MLLAIGRVVLGRLETGSDPICAVGNIGVVVMQGAVDNDMVEDKSGHLGPHLDGVLGGCRKMKGMFVRRTGPTSFPTSLRRQAIPPATIPAATLARRTQ